MFLTRHSKFLLIFLCLFFFFFFYNQTIFRAWQQNDITQYLLSNFSQTHLATGGNNCHTLWRNFSRNAKTFWPRGCKLHIWAYYIFESKGGNLRSKSGSGWLKSLKFLVLMKFSFFFIFFLFSFSFLILLLLLFCSFYSHSFFPPFLLTFLLFWESLKIVLAFKFCFIFREDGK